MTVRTRLVALNDRQRHRCMTAAVQLPAVQRYRFILQVEQKLALHGDAFVTDALLEYIIASVTQRERTG